MAKDQRYQQVHRSITNRRIKTLDQLFAVIPRSTVARDIHCSAGQLDRKLKDIGKFRLGDLFTLARLAEVRNIDILSLAAAQYEANHAAK